MSNPRRKFLVDHTSATKVTTTLIDHAVYQQAKSISIFLSMPTGELQTNGIVRDALRAGKKVFVPYITRKPASMDMLQLRNEQEFESLRPDNWGIPSLDTESINDRTNCFGHRGLQPQVETPLNLTSESGLDLVLMPCVAFDRDFNRLGHGKGYYDRFLTRYSKAMEKVGHAFRKPYLIGLALEEQVLQSPHRLPTEEWDQRVDAIIVGDRFLARPTRPDHAS